MPQATTARSRVQHAVRVAVRVVVANGSDVDPGSGRNLGDYIRKCKNRKIGGSRACRRGGGRGCEFRGPWCPGINCAPSLAEAGLATSYAQKNLATKASPIMAAAAVLAAIAAGVVASARGPAPGVSRNPAAVVVEVSPTLHVSVSVGSRTSFRLSVNFGGSRAAAAALPSPSLDAGRAMANFSRVSGGADGEGIRTDFGEILVRSDGRFTLKDASGNIISAALAPPSLATEATGHAGITMPVSGSKTGALHACVGRAGHFRLRVSYASSCLWGSSNIGALRACHAVCRARGISVVGFRNYASSCSWPNARCCRSPRAGRNRAPPLSRQRWLGPAIHLGPCRQVLCARGGEWPLPYFSWPEARVACKRAMLRAPAGLPLPALGPLTTTLSRVPRLSFARRSLVPVGLRPRLHPLLPR